MEDALAHGVVDGLQQVRHVVAEALELVAARALQLANLACGLVAFVHPVALVRPTPPKETHVHPLARSRNYTPNTTNNKPAQ